MDEEGIMRMFYVSDYQMSSLREHNHKLRYMGYSLNFSETIDKDAIIHIKATKKIPNGIPVELTTIVKNIDDAIIDITKTIAYLEQQLQSN